MTRFWYKTLYHCQGFMPETNRTFVNVRDGQSRCLSYYQPVVCTVYTDTRYRSIQDTTVHITTVYKIQQYTLRQYTRYNGIQDTTVYNIQ